MMNIEELRKARKVAEAQILAVLQSFYDKTGLHIVEVRTQNASQHFLSFGRPIIAAQSVSVDLEEI